VSLAPSWSLHRRQARQVSTAAFDLDRQRLMTPLLSGSRWVALQLDLRAEFNDALGQAAARASDERNASTRPITATMSSQLIGGT
jgi:hypothetical protein